MMGHQILRGVQEQGWADVPNLASLLQYIDDDGATELLVRNLSTGAEYTWTQWYSGDTEVGYIYLAGTLQLVATVSDGDIYDCLVP
jgi:hypothetical protein